MKIYLPIAKVDAEKREVWGYASTEARDDQGEIVKREALIAALGDYMRFANIREMHQLSAVGVAREAAVDDRGLYIGARIVDDQAWQKVIEGVYNGYSIGGRVTQRDPADYKTITGLVLNEISLVDRPANPEAVFDYWKAAGASTMPDTRFNPPIQIWACGMPEHRHLAKAEALRCQEQGALFGETARSGGFGEAGVNLIAAARSAIATAEGALEKAQNKTGGDAPYGAVEYADPGYQADGRKRYPIDTERHIRAAWNFINRPNNGRRYTAAQLETIKARIIAAWKKQIDKDGPPSVDGSNKAGRGPAQVALTKALWDVGHIARIILDLDWLEDSLTVEAAMEGDDSPQPARLQAIIAELCGFLNALVAEETSEILDETEIGGGPDAPAVSDVLIMAAGMAGAALVANLCKAGSPKMRKFAAAVLAKGKHSQGDQALLDLAYHAVDKCMGMNGLLFAEKSHIGKARDALKAAGAAPSEESTVDTARNPEVPPPMVRPPALEFRPGENATVDTAKRPPSAAGEGVLEMIAAALGKRGSGHQALMDVAHDCIGKLTDGAFCATVKAGARHSQETLERLADAHDHLVAAGAKCDAAGFAPEAEWQGTEFEPGKAAGGSLAKLLTGERAEKAALIATLTDIVPRLDQLTKRVEDIARTPLPPLAMTRSVTAISKQQDSGGAGGLSPDDLAAAFSRMSKEEQTLTLIKASYANPIHPPGLGTPKELRGE
jgi:phage head maturation protease